MAPAANLLVMTMMIIIIQSKNKNIGIGDVTDNNTRRIEEKRLRVIITEGTVVFTIYRNKLVGGTNCYQRGIRFYLPHVLLSSSSSPLSYHPSKLSVQSDRDKVFICRVCCNG